MSPIIVLILLILVLMNCTGYFNSTAPTGYRYGIGGLGFLCLVILVLYIMKIIPALV